MQSHRHTVFFVLLLLLASFSQYLFAQSFETPAEYYENAVGHIAEKDFKGGEIQLKNALQLDSEHLPSQILLGIVYLETGQPQQAELALVKARQMGADKNLIAIPMAQAMLRLDKYSKLERFCALKNRSPKVESKLQVLLGGSYIERNRPDDAEAAFLVAENLDPESPHALLAQLNLSMRQTRDEHTRDLLARLKSMAPRLPDVWMKEAQFQEYQGNLDAAFEAYNRVLELNPEYVNARVARAAIVQKRDEDHDWVLNELEPLVKKYEELLNPEMIYTYVVSLLKKGRIEEAREMTELAKKRLNFLGEDVLNQYPSLLFLDISLAIFEGDLFKAQDSANRLLSISPGNSSARLLLGKIYMEMGDSRRALDALSPIYTYKRKDPQFLSYYGRALYDTGNARDAIYELQLAKDLGYKKRDLYQSIALTYKSLGKLDEAINVLEEGLELHADDIGLGILLAQLYLEKPDLRSAETTLMSLEKLGTNDPRVGNYFGLLKVAENKLDEAEEYFNKALQQDDQFVLAMINLARIYIVRDELNEAESMFGKVLEIDSESRDAMIGMAQIADRKGNVPEAIRWFERLWGQDPNAINEAVMLIKLYRREGQYEEAVRTADKLFEKNPDNFTVLTTLLETLIEAQKPDLAIRQLKSSLRYSSDFSMEQLFQLSALQMQVDDIDGAANTLIRSLTVQDDFIPAKVQLIRLFTTMRRYEEALEQAADIKELKPESNLSDALRGDILLAAGKKDEAYDAYNNAIQKQPSTALYLNIYRLESKKSGADKAIKKLQQWASANPDDQKAQYGLALALIDIGDYQQSLEAHHALLKEQPDNPLLMNNIAWLMQIRGDMGAYEYIKSAYERFPENPAILDTYGWVLTENNQPELGLRYLRQAMSRASEDPSTRYHLALALKELGRDEEALTTLKKLIASEPDFHELPQAKAVLAQLEGQ